MKSAQDFWKQVDLHRNGKPLKELAEDMGMNYITLLNQRSQCRYPSRTDMLKMAEVLGTTLDTLVSEDAGAANITPEMEYVRRNKRAEWIIERCIENDRLLAILYSFVECLSKEAFDYLDK